MSKKKHQGQVFTPGFMVSLILDFSGYSGNSILQKHVIDNSSGDGAFLTEITRRYCTEFLKTSSDTSELVRHLETYIHGIELDSTAYTACLENLDRVLKNEFGVMTPVRFDIKNGDSILLASSLSGKMDFVIGNPPYVRVHNLETSYETVKQSRFCETGMTDLYIRFFELGLEMLKTGGTLCYITPSSWIYSVAGRNIRNYLKETGTLSGLIDMEHTQVFDGAVTYTMITKIRKDFKQPHFAYFTYDEETNSPVKQAELSMEDALINDRMFLADKDSLCVIREIMDCSTGPVHVKNGFATLADRIFIGDSFGFETDFMIPVIKASTGKMSKALFPYHKDLSPVSEEELEVSSSELLSYFKEHEEILRKRDCDRNQKQFYLFGRSQALNDVYKNKVTVNTCIRDKETVKLRFAEAGTGVYSGLYILADMDNLYDKILQLLCSDEFIVYIRSLKKYKSGGYYTFNSKELERYLNWKLKFGHQKS